MLNKILRIFIILLFVFLMFSYVYAGNIVEVDGFLMYKTSNGEYAKNTWLWLDINGDSIKECYRFDDEGHIASNYIGYDDRRTNEFGQLIENGFVMKKLSSGLVIKGEGQPYVNVKVSTGSIINSLTSINNTSSPSIEKNKNGNTILTTKLKEEIDIHIGYYIASSSKVIYANSNRDTISADSNNSNINNNYIVAGKDITRFITAKKNARTDVEKVIIFNNVIWENVIELFGNNSSIKINTKNYNYMYFEVAEQNHIVDYENDELLSLDIYVDGKFYESLEEFVESEPQIEEIEDLDSKVVELKLNISGKNKNRRVYIRNGRLKKIREKNE